jgi:hypothetical protein
MPYGLCSKFSLSHLYGSKRTLIILTYKILFCRVFRVSVFTFLVVTGQLTGPIANKKQEKREEKKGIHV